MATWWEILVGIPPQLNVVSRAITAISRVTGGDGGGGGFPVTAVGYK